MSRAGYAHTDETSQQEHSMRNLIAVYAGHHAAPVIIGALARTEKRDTLGHSGIQPWSAGAIFPAVIARVERGPTFPSYTEWLDAGRRSAPLSRFPRGSYTHWEEECAAFYALDREHSTSWELTLDSRTEEYATYDDAEKVARAMLADPVLRAKWNKFPNGLDYTRTDCATCKVQS